MLPSMLFSLRVLLSVSSFLRQASFLFVRNSSRSTLIPDQEKLAFLFHRLAVFSVATIFTPFFPLIHSDRSRAT